MKTLGQWNAYCAAGKTYGEVRRRLQEVPEALRAQVEGHVDTVSKLRRKEEEKAK